MRCLAHTAWDVSHATEVALQIVFARELLCMRKVIDLCVDMCIDICADMYGQSGVDCVACVPDHDLPPPMWKMVALCSSV